MKVLHLGAGNIYGGIERALVSYAAGRPASPEMFPHFGVTFPGQLQSELTAEGVGVTVLGPARLSRRGSVARARGALQRLLMVLRPDVVLTHGPWPHCVYGPIVKRARIPLALFLHNPLSVHWLDLLALRIEPGFVIANSRFTLRQSRWWLRSTPTAVCTYPFTTPPDFNRSEERSRLGVPDGGVVVLQVSRLDPYKGHRLLLHALAQLKEERSWCAWLVGAPQPGKEAYARSLVSLCEDLGLAKRVQFLGHRTDIPRLLAAADVFCHPNISAEAFGIVFVESLQAGLPIIATKMGGAEEILGAGGGKLVPPKATELATALRTLICDKGLRLAMSERGREVARQKYTLEAGVRDLAMRLSAFAFKTDEPGPRPWV